MTDLERVRRHFDYVNRTNGHYRQHLEDIDAHLKEDANRERLINILRDREQYLKDELARLREGRNREADSWRQHWREAEAEIGRLTNQRDTLLAALREIAGNEDYAEEDMVTRLVNRQNIACDAISEVEEEK